MLKRKKKKKLRRKFWQFINNSDGASVPTCDSRKKKGERRKEKEHWRMAGALLGIIPSLRAIWKRFRVLLAWLVA